ncbi:unnamed protein product, partial [Linum tenue]
IFSISETRESREAEHAESSWEKNSKAPILSPSDPKIPNFLNSR